MKISIKVITNARKREIIADGPELKVKLTSLPRDGRANEELIEYLAECFNVRKSEIQIVQGEKDRRKVIALALDYATFSAILREKVKVTTG
ncbi:MAG TPA: DUF167 domain-containing protein [Syntrophorhabdaceae bacterium]|nr:DUF167 domain-containing protein [Syntrophorhabdaceae bacterium]